MVSEKSKNRVFRGIGASPGIVIGEARVARNRVVVVEAPVAAEDIPAEIGRFHAALPRTNARWWTRTRCNSD